MTDTHVWYVLAAIGAIGILGGGLTLAHHKILDWWENRWPKADSWQTTTGSIFAIREDEPRKVSDLGGFFGQEDQQPVDPWNDVETWTVEEQTAAREQLEVIKALNKLDLDAIPKVAPLAEEPLPAALFDGLTAEYKQVNPQVAGRTQSWMKPTDTDEPKPRRRVPAARKPAGES